MWRFIILVVWLAACGDNKQARPDDAGPGDAVVDGSQPLGPCLDRQGDLVRPPTGQLPCDLLPPGFTP